MKTEKIILNILGLHCASCALNIEGALKKTPGILSVRVNFALEKAYIEFEPKELKISDLIVAIGRTGYKAFLPEKDLDREKEIRQKETQGLKNKFSSAFVLSVILMLVSMIPEAYRISKGNLAFAQFLLASAVLICGRDFFIHGFSTLVKIRRANMDTLVALGVGSAYLYSFVMSINIWLGKQMPSTHNLYYEAAAFLLTFILLGKYLEALTKRKTSGAIRKLWSLKPKTALIARGDKEIEISAEDLKVGDIVIVKPGQRIPADGEIIAGYSSVDESMITGESMPQEKSQGDKVSAGTINKNGYFKFKVTKFGRESVLAQIIKLVEEAQGSKAPVEELADRVAAIFVPAVFLIALTSFLVWFLVGQSFVFALNVFIAVLIIACPCSLGLATPTAVMAGTGKAAENGIIIKNAASLQIARKIKIIIFDKTGTLTVGRPALTDVISYAQDKDEILGIAASLEKESEHPLAETIVSFAKLKGILLTQVHNFVSLPGEGVIGELGGFQALLGNRKLMNKKGIDIQSAGRDMDRLENEGKTVMLLAKAGRLLGLLAVRDNLKEFSSQAVVKLKEMGKEVFIISGDNKRTVQAIARELSIEKVLAEVSPEGKLNEIKELQAQGLKVAFVGDGINDAPALTQADLGLAIGAGTDIAVEAGDIILIKNDPRDVVTALDLSRYTMRKIEQNLFWAFLYNSLGIPVAAGVLYPHFKILLNPVLAGLAMAFSSLSVVANSLLMQRYRRI